MPVTIELVAAGASMGDIVERLKGSLGHVSGEAGILTGRQCTRRCLNSVERSPRALPQGARHRSRVRAMRRAHHADLDGSMQKASQIVDVRDERAAVYMAHAYGIAARTTSALRWSPPAGRHQRDDRHRQRERRESELC